MITQKKMTLKPLLRGFHLITDEILTNLGPLPNSGLINIFCQHTSCGISINENCDPSVRVDLNRFFDELVKEDLPFYTHTAEGSDDMPAHIKSTITGHEVTIPIIDGQLGLGTWQGIYLCEFRNHGGPRKLILTIHS